VQHPGRESSWSGPDPWPTVGEVIGRFLDLSGKSGANLTGGSHLDVIKGSRFGLQTVDEFRISYQRVWTIEEIIGFVYTKSYQARWRFGDRADRFEQEIRQSLSRLNPTGTFRGHGEIQVLRIRK
jgi:hypothetical protein